VKTLKEKVLACENICGTHIALNYPGITEVFGYLGFDFIWIDSEHSPLSCEDILNHLTFAHAAGTPGIVRAGMHDRNQVKRILEMGPDGIIFPMVNTPEEADNAMKMCLYPPKGNRGFGPLRAARYGLRDMDEYIRNTENEVCRFIQIETKQAVKNLPEIVKNPYIDGFIFGPCDLSGSIGELNQVFGENNISLIKEAIGILKAAKKTIGVSTGSADPEVIRFWHDLGINMISSGVDYGYLIHGASDNLKNIRKIQAE